MKKFTEVRNDYFDDDTKMYFIDGWVSDDDDSEGEIIATIDEDGVVEWRNGNGIMCVHNKDFYSNVWEAIEEAKEKQKERKQELVDKCIEEIKRDVIGGDVSAIDGMLILVTTKILKDYLPEH